MQLRWLPMLWGLMALIFVAVMGCSEGTIDEQSREVIAGGGDSPEVRIAALSPTPDAVLEKLDVFIEPNEGGFKVDISANEDISDIKEMFLEVQYDANLNHAHGLNADATENAAIIGLAIEAEPGVIDYGIVSIEDDGPSPTGDLDDYDPLPTDGIEGGDDGDLDPPGPPEPWPGLEAGDPLMSFTLLPGGNGRETSAAATSNRARARNLELEKCEDGRWMLSWDYTNPGDNNQDGLVGVTDLTQIGQNYMTRLRNSWDDPLRHIDGNQDGEINASDITAIGQNYEAEIFQYEIELFDEALNQYLTVGTLRLEDMGASAAETVRFSYTFGPQYVEKGWYRVSSLSRNLERGAPSEEISEVGRRLAATDVGQGRKVTITVSTTDLPYPIAHLNSLRVVYPSSYVYVRDSANPGTIGGSRDASDGIWASFAPALLFPNDTFFVEENLGGGKTAIDFNVTTLHRELPGAPVGHGALLNFQLESAGDDPLTLEFHETSDDGNIKRTYYTDSSEEEHFFGNAIGFAIQ